MATPHGILVVADTNGQSVLPESLPAIGFARHLSALTGLPFEILLTGDSGIAQAAESLSAYGAARVRTMADEALALPSAERIGAVVVEIALRDKPRYICSAAGGLTQDVLAWVAGACDLPMISDVIAANREGDEIVFSRAVYAGASVAKCLLSGPTQAITVRPTAWPDPVRGESRSPVEAVAWDKAFAWPRSARLLHFEAEDGSRPDLASARIVVAGGRALRDSVAFDTLIGGLADKLHAAVGSSGGAVGLGIAPPETLIGQTGKTVAPDLYIAAGISGSDQHVAGMIDSQVIVAIDTDPKAAIFRVADYGLVGDVHTVIPELIEKL